MGGLPIAFILKGGGQSIVFRPTPRPQKYFDPNSTPQKKFGREGIPQISGQRPDDPTQKNIYAKFDPKKALPRTENIEKGLGKRDFEKGHFERASPCRSRGSNGGSPLA